MLDGEDLRQRYDTTTKDCTVSEKQSDDDRPEADTTTDRGDVGPGSTTTEHDDPKPAVDAEEPPTSEESEDASAGDVDTKDDDAASEDEGASGGRPRWRRWALFSGLGVGAIVMIAAIVLAAVFGTKLHHRIEVDDAARAATDTARAYSVTLTSIDSGSIDQNFRQVLDGATGEFKNTYSQSSAQLKALLVQNKAKSSGTVVNWAVKSATTDRVVVLLFVDQTVTNTQSPDPRVDRSRITMTMQKVDGRWLASSVELA